MHPIDIQKCLDSMEIVVDTREQPSERSKRRYEAFSAPYHRQTLSYGDYTYNFTLPDGEPLFPAETTIEGHCVIERKMDLAELSSNFCQERDRFKAEFERIKATGAKVYLLVEGASFEALYAGRYRTKFNPKAYSASLWAWCARYNAVPVFCKPEMSGRIIHDILYRELKEKLEGGFYG